MIVSLIILALAVSFVMSVAIGRFIARNNAPTRTYGLGHPASIASEQAYRRSNETTYASWDGDTVRSQNGR